jgi:hypothetical protein
MTTLLEAVRLRDEGGGADEMSACIIAGYDGMGFS